ncbi:HNH homing endonuclease [Acinetobacter phage Liucustia]|nr:HNH homing endonuclease [Acinetobacter phage Liucustia]UYL86279.1 putative tail sheath protein [Acinetobacter phage vB_AbaM_CP14]
MQKSTDCAVRYPVGFDSDGLIVSSSGVLLKGDGSVRTLYDNGKGYKFVRIHNRETQGAKQFYVHRLVAEVFIGDIKGKQVNHIDGDKSNNDVSNLEIVTPSENIRHSHKTGLSKPRREYGSVEFRSDKVFTQAYLFVKIGVGNITQIAKSLNMSRTTLSSVMNKRSHAALTNWLDEVFNL